MQHEGRCKLLHGLYQQRCVEPSSLTSNLWWLTLSLQVLGIVGINWLIIADQSNQGIFDPDCLMLAQLHSDAVDYPKSGQPVPLNKIPRLKFRAKPDWNAPETLGRESDKFYNSNKAIGR